LISKIGLYIIDFRFGGKKMNYKEITEEFLKNNSLRIKPNLKREALIRECFTNREASLTSNGALYTSTPPESTGRSPKDTYLVCSEKTEDLIDWKSPNNIPLPPETFQLLFEDAVKILEKKPIIYATDRVIGADSDYALPVKTISDRALPALFTDNMFRKPQTDLHKSKLFHRAFNLLVLPYDKLDAKKYQGKLRTLSNGNGSNMAVVLDLENSIGLVLGSAYLGSIKKLMFTAMNFYLPEIGILPLHASANEGNRGDIALFLGLSGTGKTTLSADSSRSLLGDDEHGWNENGIANFENGCYAKLINLDPVKEPEIYQAITHQDEYIRHGAIIENTMVYSGGIIDFSDVRLTENSRGSYPLAFLKNIKKSSIGTHPEKILFLTADANGVLPPVAKLNKSQAMLWFLMGYTSKLAGTETGIVDPVSTFSRFFGEPFMPQNPDVYTDLLGEKMTQHQTEIFLINTGWTGGPYGIGRRIDITVTKSIIRSILDNKLESVKYREDSRFHILAPTNFPDIDQDLLTPENLWQNKSDFTTRADKLAADFSSHFDKVYADKNLSKDIIKSCPGK
jgi:phosphoenolpyruvate carboxykinase (ATP)